MHARPALVRALLLAAAGTLLAACSNPVAPTRQLPAVQRPTPGLYQSGSTVAPTPEGVSMGLYQSGTT